MFARNKELWAALAAIIVISAGYFAVTGITGRLPAASHLLGHGIGGLGFVLMLMTETLYTLRKRAKSARWGRISNWLKFHIFTGLVGPYMALLHPAMRFHGVAAALTLMTVVVVISGVAGRYIYTRVPRTIEVTGVSASAALEARAVAPVAADGPAVAAAAYSGVPAARKGLALWRAVHVPLTFLLFLIATAHIVGAIYYATLLR